MKKTSIILFCVLSFSCGIKGPPLPPVPEETIQKQKASEVVPTPTPTPVAPEAAKKKKTSQ